MMTDADPPKNWQGNDLHCAGCANLVLSQAGRCQLLHACVEDRYAKRIDRFFDWNPDIAKDYLAHAYFEVRAFSVKHADVFHLPALMIDPDWRVRYEVVSRMLNDEDSAVRELARSRLPPEFLAQGKQVFSLVG
ncbi:MAG: hypothetical protein HZA59_01955 [Hydrogenophilales bacterium]|nr:hypothetical protein [Hydrogenophilales bacterium]